MLGINQIEELISLIGSLDRDGLVRQFFSYQGSFPLDFTPEFLASLSIDRLRHLLLAVCLQSQRLPKIEAGSDLQSAA